MSGFALAFLLWMLAAMTVLVSGLVVLARTDVQMAALQLDRARAQSFGRGAVHLLLRELSLVYGGVGDNPGKPFVREYNMDGYRVVAQARPVSAFLSLNGAPEADLISLFQYLGGLSEDEATSLALSAIDYRSTGLTANGDSTGGRMPFKVVEDLLRVRGMTRDVYDRARLFVHALPGGGEGVDLDAAPPALALALNGEGDPMLTREPRASGDVATQLPGSSEFGSAPAAGDGGEYCIDVFVHFEGSGVAMQRTWADGNSSGVGDTPWSLRRVLPVEFLSNEFLLQQFMPQVEVEADAS